MLDIIYLLIGLFNYKGDVNVTSYYKTYTNAEKEELCALPNFIPQDAYDIHLYRNNPYDYKMLFKYISSENFQKLIHDYEDMQIDFQTDTIAWPKYEEINIHTLKNIPASVDITTAKCYALWGFHQNACLIDDQKHKQAYYFHTCRIDR
jgi:hypothetical protein